MAKKNATQGVAPSKTERRPGNYELTRILLSAYAQPSAVSSSRRCACGLLRSYGGADGERPKPRYCRLRYLPVCHDGAGPHPPTLQSLS